MHNDDVHFNTKLDEKVDTAGVVYPDQLNINFSTGELVQCVFSWSSGGKRGTQLAEV